jgi:hypothetical protein
MTKKVRARETLLTAEQLTESKRVRLGSKLVIAHPGDWLILDIDGHEIDVVKVLTSDYEIIEPGLLLPETCRPDLERVLGLGVMKSPKDLVKAVDRLARLEIGGILVDFTPGQWEELTRKAAVQDQTVEVYLNRMVKKFTQDLWGL